MERRSQKRLLKIQELAARAAVSKSTIHYYMEKKLLPPSIKINRTTALYDASCVERIRLIRDLQKKAFLPLGRIKRLIDMVPDTEMLENILLISAQYTEWVANASASRSLSQPDAIAEFGFGEDTLARLEELGVLHPETRRRHKVYHPEDVEILRILLQMNKRGFSPARGWPLEALSIYVDAARRLAEKEVEQLFQRMTGGLHPRDTLDLFGEMGEDLFLGLFLWLRRKAMRKAFAVRVKTMKKQPGAAGEAAG